MQTQLVGDLILSARELGTDLPKALSAPSPPTVSYISDPNGFTSSVYVVMTQLTPWGESLPSTELSCSPTGQGLVFAGTCSRAATALRFYLGTLGAGLEDEYAQVALEGGENTFSGILVDTVSTLLPGYPPTRGSAYLPDSDGTAVSAYTIYRWINEALDAATAITDGIRDVTGFPSVAGQAQYPLIGNWRKLSNGFYDGYPFAMGSKNDVFRHSQVSGIVGTMVLNTDSQTQDVEVWPQPSRTAGNGTLPTALTAAATSLTFTPGSNGWVLGFGLALLGPYPADLSACEIISYSGTTSTTLSGLTRGVGGTVPQAWPANTPVTEMNVYLSGQRTPIHYEVGQSTNVLALPPAWIDALRSYLEGRFKSGEQDDANASKKMQEFQQKCQAIRGNRAVVGPRQVQVGGGGGLEVAAGAGSYFGGRIIP